MWGASPPTFCKAFPGQTSKTQPHKIWPDYLQVPSYPSPNASNYILLTVEPKVFASWRRGAPGTIRVVENFKPPYCMLCNSASGPEIGFPGRILAGQLPGCIQFAWVVCLQAALPLQEI
jgi:hypothetical protein